MPVVSFAVAAGTDEADEDAARALSGAEDRKRRPVRAAAVESRFIVVAS